MNEWKLEWGDVLRDAWKFEWKLFITKDDFVFAVDEFGFVRYHQLNPGFMYMGMSYEKYNRDKAPMMQMHNLVFSNRLLPH